VTGGPPLRARVAAAAVLALGSPSFVLGPGFAAEIGPVLPVGASAAAAPLILPDKDWAAPGLLIEIDPDPEATLRFGWHAANLDPDWWPQPLEEPIARAFDAPWRLGESLLALEETIPPMLAVLATDGADAEHVAETLPTDAIDPEATEEEDPKPGIEAPSDEEKEGEAWSPAEVPGGEGAVGAEGVEDEGGDAPERGEDGEDEGSIDPLPVEQMVGNTEISGEVSDATTLESIPGAIVTISGTGREAETDAQGKFRIDGLPAGDYTVEALKLGYEIGQASASPRPGSPAEVRIALRVKASDTDEGEYMLAEETIVGEYQESAEADFNLDLGESLSLSSGLSAEDFAKENVSDAGEALAKVSGANVVGGKFAVVRGLADRYIGTTFNSGQISSAVSDRKAIELDLFPTSAIQAIDVAKTYRSDLFGDFGGAAIDIQSRFFPNEPFAFAKTKYQWDPDLPGNFLTVPGKDLGYLGTTSNPLNPQDYTRRNPDTGQVRLIVSPAGEALPVWTQLDGTRSSYPVLDDASDEFSYGIGFGDTVEVTDYLDIGVLFGHGWKSGSSYNQSPQFRAPEREWFQEDFGNYTEWDLYFAGSARLNEQHEVSAVFFRKHIGENNVLSATDLREPNGEFSYGQASIQAVSGTRPFYGADAEILGGFLQLEPLERDLRIVQLSGKSELGRDGRGPRVKWSFTDSDAEEKRPNTTFQEFTTLDFDGEALDEVQAQGEAFIIDFAENALGLPAGSLNFQEARQAFIDNGAGALLGRFETERLPVRDPSLGEIDTLAVGNYVGNVGPGNILTRAVQSVEESTTDGHIDFVLPYFFSEDDEDRGFELGLGAGRVEKERRNRGSLYELVYENLSAAGESRGGFDIDDFYPTPDGTGGNLGEILFGNTSGLPPFFTGEQATGPYYQDGSIGTDNFLGLIANNADSTHDFDSFFASGHFFFEDFFIRGGIRYESEERRAEFIEPKPLNEQDPPPILENVWLPSVSVGSSFFDNRLSFLAAWSRTVARPTFFEWVPTRSFDLSTGFIRSGNPDLLNSQITNFDFSTEFKPTETQTYRLSVFRKEIVDPIVSFRVPGVADSITFDNGDIGLISGVEFEAELSEVGPFTLRSNVTYIDATLEYAFNTGQQVSVNFPFQPNWIVNFNLGYENEEWDFGANLIYNFTGEYATLLRTTPTSPDVVRDAVHRLDFVVRKGFDFDWDGRLALNVGIENLLGTDQEFRLSGGPPDQDGRLRQRLQTDRLYFAELRYDF